MKVATALGLVVALAQPATAQTLTGNVNLTGFVAARCATGGSFQSTVSSTLALGELAASDGSLNETLSGSSETSPAASSFFYGGCTSSGFRLTIAATRLTTAQGVQLPSSSDDVDYTVQVRVAKLVGGFEIAEYTTSASAGPPVELDVAAYVADVNPNIEVRVFALTSENPEPSLMKPGNYAGTITFTMTPQ